MTYVIKSVRDTGTITYHCGSPRSALEKVNDFRQAEYWDITIMSDDKRGLSEDELVLLDALERPELVGA